MARNDERHADGEDDVLVVDGFSAMADMVPSLEQDPRFAQVLLPGLDGQKLFAFRSLLGERRIAWRAARPRESAADLFRRLAAEWRKATCLLSSITEKAMHPAYQRIIGLGWTAVPLLLAELERAPDHWFWALKAITRADPVPPEHRGRLSDMARDWLDWARREGVRW